MQKVTARAIIQMMGAPKEHLTKTMKMYMENISAQHKGIAVLGEERSRPKKEKSMYSMFTEVELEANSAADLVWFCFDYMPSSVEVLEPGEIRLRAQDFTSFLNDLQDKLHKVDMAVKNLSAENQVIKKNGFQLLRNLALVLLRKPKDTDTVARQAGVPKEHMQKVMDALEKDGKIKKEGSLYQIT